ncbi:MAG: hypothetical protein AAFN08_02360 [Cyanobacteria bacterium J06559_3]
MKIVSYQRHELWYEPEARIAPLSTFVYDIPYLDGCGIFPPLHVLNEVFASGGDGGMSPSTSWEPFTITSEEYDELWQILEQQDPKSLSDQARCTHVKFKRDPEFEKIRGRFAWMKACCDKHRDTYSSIDANC